MLPAGGALELHSTQLDKLKLENRLAQNIWLWLEGMQQKPAANNKLHFLPRLCFINV